MIILIPVNEINEDGLIALLKKRVADAGSQKIVAYQLEVSEQFLCRVLKKRDLPGKKILAALNLEAVTQTTYRTKDNESKSQSA